MIRIIRRFAVGFLLPLKAGLFLLRRRSLLVLASVPLVLNILLYTAAVILVVRYYDVWFGLLFEQPQSWYLLVGYEVLNFLAFLLILAVLLFSFIFVGTTLAAPFLELLSEQVEQVLRGREAQPVQLHQWLIDLLRSLGHTLTLLIIWLVTFPLNFLPVVGQATWLLGGWLLLAYNFASFALERRRWSFREQWRVLLRDWAATLGFGSAVFVLMIVPLVGLVVLPTAVVAGTMLVLDIEDRE